MSQEEDSSPSSSPPPSQSQEPSRQLSSSHWTIPPDSDLASTFKYSKTKSAGLASSGSKTQTGDSETRARGAGGSASRGLGSAVQGQNSRVEMDLTMTGSVGSPSNRDDRAGLERDEDVDDERLANELNRRGAAMVNVGDEQGVQTGSKAVAEQQDQRKEQSTGAVPRPSKSPLSTAANFASQFRLGHPSGGSFQQSQLPSYATANSAANRAPATQQFFANMFGRSTPPSSHTGPVSTTAEQLHPHLSHVYQANPASRPLGATSGSRSMGHPPPPPPLQFSHSSAQHHEPSDPHRPIVPFSPQNFQSRANQNEESGRPSATSNGAAGGGGGGASNSKKRGLAGTSGDGHLPRVGSNSSTKAGGDGSRAPRGEGSPSTKKRKGEKGAVGLDDVIATISGYKVQCERKDAEVISLRTRLVDKEKEVERLRGEKEALKRDALGKVNLALSRLETTRKELVDVSSGMRAATNKLETEMGSPTTVAELRDELNTTKQLFERRYFDVDGNLWLERNEESRMNALRTLQTEVQQRQDVINLLRDQLATKTGEIVEARDRIAQLEQLQTTHHLAAADLELLRRESRSREDILRERLVEAENRLDEALVKGRDREAGFEEKLERAHTDFEDKLERTRKDLDDARVALSASDIKTATLSASNLRLEKDLQESTAEADTLKTKLEALDMSFNEFRSKARAEKESLEEDLRSLRFKNAEQEAILTRQAAERDELLSLSAQLTKVKIDLNVAKQKLSDDTASASTLLEREKLVSQDLSDRNDALTAQLHANEAQLIEGVTRLSDSQHMVKTLQSSLDGVKRSEEELKARESQLTVELERAHAELSATRVSHQRQDAEAESRLRTQVEELQNQISTLRGANEALLQQQHQAEHKIGEFKNAISTLEDATVSTENEARRLQRELSLANAARDSLLRFEGELAQLKRDQAFMLQNRIKETVASCQEGHSREKAQLSNELKRANNKLEELTTRNQKLSTELAKFKNRPMIDPHIASSSPAISPSRGRPPLEQPEPEELGVQASRLEPAPTFDDSSTDTVAATTLSAIAAMDQEEDDEELAAGVDEGLKHTKSKKEDNRVSSESTVQTALGPPGAVPVKKDKGKSVGTKAGGAGAQSSSRALRTTRRRTMDPEQGERNGDEDEIEDVTTQIYRPEDEIEEVTQENRAGRDKGRPMAKTTYSRKRKEVKH